MIESVPTEACNLPFGGGDIQIIVEQSCQSRRAAVCWRSLHHDAVLVGRSRSGGDQKADEKREKWLYAVL